MGVPAWAGFWAAEVVRNHLHLLRPAWLLLNLLVDGSLMVQWAVIETILNPCLQLYRTPEGLKLDPSPKALLTHR